MSHILIRHSDRCDVLENLEETSSEVKKLISCSIQTGSYLWGLNKEGSDIDIIIAPSMILNHTINWHDVCLQHKGQYIAGEYNQTDFKSCYVKAEGKIYNLLFTKTLKIYMEWVMATVDMTSLIMSSDKFKEKMRNKKERVKHFEKLKEKYRTL